MRKLDEALFTQILINKWANLMDVGCTLDLYIIDLRCWLLHPHRALSLR